MLVVGEHKNGAMRVSTITPGESLCEQSHRDQVNINTIVARARRGIMPATNPSQCNYGDFSSGTDFYTAQLRIKDAERDFMRLDVEIRKRFQNDPAQMIDFLADPDNQEEAQRLGLIPAAEAAETAPVDVVEKVPATEKSGVEAATEPPTDS